MQAANVAASYHHDLLAVMQGPIRPSEERRHDVEPQRDEPLNRHEKYPKGQRPEIQGLI